MTETRLDSTILAQAAVDWRARLAGGAVGLAALCGLSVTLLLFAGLRKLEDDKLMLDFQQRAHVRALALDEGLNNAIAGLQSVNQLFASADGVTRTQFHTFVQPILARAPYTQSISYLRDLPQAERGAYEAAMRREQPGFELRQMRDGAPVPADTRARYLVIDYLEPLAENAAALGLDISFPPFSRAERQRGVDTGLASASDPIRLAQGAEPRTGIVITMPVYRHGAALTDAAARRAALVGETAITIRPGDLVPRIFAAAGLAGMPDMDFRVDAGAPDPARVPIFASAARPGAAAPRWLYWAPAPAFAQDFDVAGKRWRLTARRRPASADEHAASLFALALGVLLSAAGAACIHLLGARAGHIQRRVDERTAQLKLANQTLLLRERAIESSTNAIVIIGATKEALAIVYANPAFERISGYSLAEVIGRHPGLLYAGEPDQPGIEELRAAVRGRREGQAVLRNYRKDGSMFWNDIRIAPVRDEAGQVRHFVAIQTDITAARDYQTALLHQATHDALTGLPNRLLLLDRLRQAITQAAGSGESLWLLSIDLDRFKFMNGRLGHKGGDRLLKVVAERLRACVREADTVVRMGGDEFAVLLRPEHGGGGPAAGDPQRIGACVAAPIHIDGQDLFLTCGIGIAVYPGDGDDADLLLERADIAMYRAKETGNNNVQFYTAAMNERLGERLLIEGALRCALERHEFELHYQPQVDTNSGRIVGMEALIRWRHPELGMVAPNRFIGLAEENGLIIPIGAWVLRTACLQLLDWQSDGRAPLRMAVNISARQVAADDFVASVAALLAETGLAPHCLELELTESLVMNDVEHAIGIMHQLKRLGVTLAIDDFGTGYSSLAHLKRFEIDVLKIDQTFVRDLTVDPDDAAIVTTIIALAANLDLEVISEGVETLDQVNFLRLHGCHRMQGYHFGRPVPARQFEQVLRANEAQLDAASRDAA